MGLHSKVQETVSLSERPIVLLGRERRLTDRRKHHGVPGSRRRLLLCILAGLRVADDLPAGGGVAYVGGAAARPRQKAKAAADRVRKTSLRSQLQSGITTKNRRGSQRQRRVLHRLCLMFFRGRFYNVGSDLIFFSSNFNSCFIQDSLFHPRSA